MAKLLKIFFRHEMNLHTVKFFKGVFKPCQTSKVEVFAKIVTKSFISDVSKGSEYASVLPYCSQGVSNDLLLSLEFMENATMLKY